MDSAAGITAAMRECYSFEIECQDKRMNYNYKNHLVSIDVDIRKKIIDAQRLWVKFRDENCAAFASQEDGGTLSSVMSDSCYLKMTTLRASDFQK